MSGGDPVATAAAGEEGEAHAEASGDRFIARMCRYWGRGVVNFQRGDVTEALSVLTGLVVEADAAKDVFHGLLARIALAHGMLIRGDAAEARKLSAEAVEMGSVLGPFVEMWALAPSAQAALAMGDVVAATEANDVAWQRVMAQPELAIANVMPTVELAFVRGDFDEARRLADVSVAPMMGWHRARALTTRAHVAIAQRDLERAECDAHDALTLAREIQVFQVVPDALEILMELGCATGTRREAARLAGAASAIRRVQGGTIRFAIYEPGYAASLADLRNDLGEEFDTAWAEGGAFLLEEAIAYAQRGRGERKRPSTGWIR